MKISTGLDQIKKERFADGERVLTEVKALLEGNVSKENEVLRHIGLDTEIAIGESEREKIILNEQYETLYEGNIYHIDDLRKLGMNYRLFFKPARMYRGTIPADLGAVLLRFKETHHLNVNASENSDSGKFFVLAPPKLFKDYKPVNYFETFMEIKNKRLLRASLDPSVFYQIDSQHYLLLKEWGNDFSPIRRVVGELTKTGILMTMLNIFTWVAILFTGIFLLYFIQDGKEITEGYSFRDRLSKLLTILWWLIWIGGTIALIIMNISGNFEDTPISAKRFSSKTFWKEDFPQRN